MNINKKTAQVLQVLKLSIEITNSSDVDIFVEYHSHINGISIRVYLEGWSTDRLQPDFSKSIYLDWDSGKDLEEIINYLKNVKEAIK